MQKKGGWEGKSTVLSVLQNWLQFKAPPTGSSNFYAIKNHTSNHTVYRDDVNKQIHFNFRQ